MLKRTYQLQKSMFSGRIPPLQIL